LLRAVTNVQPTDDRDAFRGENWSGPHSGFYGTPSLRWYAGVATFGAGIDDELAAAYLADGYESHRELLDHRAALAGDDGSPITYTLHYALQRYPYAEFNFFHSVASAMGRDLAGDWPHLARLPEYVFWNWLPGGRHFGAGDDFHHTNQLPFDYLDMHLARIVHFYADHVPEKVGFAKWLRERIPVAVDLAEVPSP